MKSIFKRLNENKKKQLDVSYNYYESIRIKTNQLYDKHHLHQYTRKPYKEFLKIPMDDNIAREIFYNFNLNLCNQMIYHYSYHFTQNDINFIAEYEIEKILDDIIKTFVKDIEKMKQIENIK